MSSLQDDTPLPSVHLLHMCVKTGRRGRCCCIWPFHQKNKNFPETYQQNSACISFAKCVTWPALAAEDWKASISLFQPLRELASRRQYGDCFGVCQQLYLTKQLFFKFSLYVFSINNTSQRFPLKCIYIILFHSVILHSINTWWILFYVDNHEDDS